MDLQDKAEFFCSSTKLQSIATGLKRIIDKQKIEERETEYFTWGANLLGQMDWHSEHYIKGEHPEMSVIATELRPKFYEILLQRRIPFDTKFSEGIYKTLKSHGKKVQLGTGELKRAYQIFRSMADTILIELNLSNI